MRARMPEGHTIGTRTRRRASGRAAPWPRSIQAAAAVVHATWTRTGRVMRVHTSAR
jgi:hypothetical protein